MKEFGLCSVPGALGGPPPGKMLKIKDKITHFGVISGVTSVEGNIARLNRPLICILN
jgi:hypothetical protein